MTLVAKLRGIAFTLGQQAEGLKQSPFQSLNAECIKLIRQAADELEAALVASPLPVSPTDDEQLAALRQFLIGRRIQQYVYSVPSEHRYELEVESRGAGTINIAMKDKELFAVAMAAVAEATLR